MAKQHHAVVYEIVDIPLNFEVAKLKEFCVKLASEHESSIPSLRNSECSTSEILDDFDLEESPQKSEDFKDNNENKEDDTDSDFSHDQPEKQQGPKFIFHLDTNLDRELHSETCQMFENIFENMSFKIKSVNKNEAQPSERFVHRKSYNNISQSK